WQSYDAIPATAIAWGDIDGDGWADLFVGTHGGPTLLFHNTGSTLEQVWQSDESETTWTLDLADMDGDGDLDLAAGSRVYRNDGGDLRLFWSSGESVPSDVAWATWQGGPYPCRW